MVDAGLSSSDVRSAVRRARRVAWGISALAVSLLVPWSAAGAQSGLTLRVAGSISGTTVVIALEPGVLTHQIQVQSVGARGAVSYAFEAVDCCDTGAAGYNENWEYLALSSSGVLSSRIGLDYEEYVPAMSFEVDVQITGTAGAQQASIVETVKIVIGDVPEASVRNLAISSQDSSSITLDWDPPARVPGNPDISYDIWVYRTADRVTAAREDANQNVAQAGPFTIQGIEPDAVGYDIFVVAYYCNGTPVVCTYLDAEYVTNQNAAPRFTSAAMLTVAENTTLRHRVTAVDADAVDSDVTYAITGGADRASFRIDADSGELRSVLGLVLDYESQSSYQITVTATSGAAHRALSAEQDITIDVTDVDEDDGVEGGGEGSEGGGGSGGGGGGSAEFDVGVATFVVANGWSPADVGAAAVLASGAEHAVVTYTAGDELSEETATLLSEALPAEVIIVGGTAAVSHDVRTGIGAASDASDITRFTGADRTATAAAAARRLLGSPAEASRVTLVVANGWSAPDVGAAAALAASSSRTAVLYTAAGELSAPSAAVMREYDVARVIVVGGTTAVGAAVERQISAVVEESAVTRLAGADRIDTAAQAARRVLGNPAAAPDGVTLVVANGWSPPDVGVAAAFAAASDAAAVVYTAADRLPEATAAMIREYQPAAVVIIGGRNAVTPGVRSAIAQAAPASSAIRRITGDNRIDTAARAARSILASR